VKPSVYVVKVAGKTFEVQIGDGVASVASANGDGARGRPELTRVALHHRHGPLAALVSPEGSQTVSVEAGPDAGMFDVTLPGGRPLRCEVEDERARLARAQRRTQAESGAGPRAIRAVMAGIVLKVLVEPGASVSEKDAVLVVEAMKMQNEIRAGVAGTVTKLHVRAGQPVAPGAVLVELAARSDA
jgi:biotin carboxyl carrier protein